jgi:RsiW-degrading membrane proteinase PrsW (M82 family)
MWHPVLVVAAASSAVTWASLAARGAGDERPGLARRALLGGAAAFGFAFLAFEVADRAGAALRFERLSAGDGVAFALAAAIGLVEEGAKLVGLLLVVERGVRDRTALAAAVGVAAGFAALETVVVFGAEGTGLVALVRAGVGPAAHALLLVPAALAVAPALRSRHPALALALPLLAAAALHGAGDLCLALPGLGRVGYALALAAPALLLYARARRPRTAAHAPVPTGSEGA